MLSVMFICVSRYEYAFEGRADTLQLGFVIPLGAKPDQCYNEITPNDMYTSMACAWSGAFILSGALTAVAWVLIRAFSMHLQICWDV